MGLFSIASTNKRKRHEWTQESLEEAIGQVWRIDCTQQYKIPKQTLSDKIRGRTNVKAQLGRSTALTKNEEEIVEICILFADWGFGLKMSEVMNLSQSIVLRKGKIHSFMVFRQQSGVETF